MRPPVPGVEDFRIAVDELCATLIEPGEGDPLRLVFELARDALVVVGTTTASPDGAIDDDWLNLSYQILDVVTDDHGLERGGDNGRRYGPQAPLGQGPGMSGAAASSMTAHHPVERPSAR